jgi:hypothetical protein
MVVLLGRDHIPRGMGHGSWFGVPPVRVPGRRDGEAARGTLPEPGGRGTSALTCRRRPGSAGGYGVVASLPGRQRVTALEALASPAAGEWLGRWLASRMSLRASTARSYASHIRGYLVPYLGGIPLAALTAGEAMFTAVIRDEAAVGQPVSAATLHRIHATLRGAQRRGPRRADRRQPGLLPAASSIRPAAAAGMDSRADRALAARGVAASGGGLDRHPDGPVPAPGARSPLTSIHAGRNRAIRHLEAMGYRVSLDQAG